MLYINRVNQYLINIEVNIDYIQNNNRYDKTKNLKIKV